MYFSQTFKALNSDFQIQGLSRTFKVRVNPDIIPFCFNTTAKSLLTLLLMKLSKELVRDFLAFCSRLGPTLSF